MPATCMAWGQYRVLVDAPFGDCRVLQELVLGAANDRSILYVHLIPSCLCLGYRFA